MIISRRVFMEKKLSSFYEKFHKKIKPQKRIVGKKNFTYRIVLGVLDKYLDSGMRILDLGCGVGTLSFYMALKGNKIIGVDISKKAVDICRKNVELLNLPIKPVFLVGDFVRLKFKDKFDFVLCSEVVEHLKDDQKAILKIYNCLKDTGTLILSTPSKNAPLHKWGFAKSFDKKVGHLRRYRVDDLIALCKNAGFKIMDTRKTEGVIRNSLFLFHCDFFLKLVNRFTFFSNIITFLDSLALKLFGESQIFVIARKP